ncbi:uncharacterized protein LOC113464508, partial [Ceratina calcarata]|uniref:Uncharacterized protein LOC113464508 n=1 Tax=Ceratina calcarata TaxID=156304 RepID=A0AAJ7WCJ9_9HYME
KNGCEFGIIAKLGNIFLIRFPIKIGGIRPWHLKFGKRVTARITLRNNAVVATRSFTAHTSRIETTFHGLVVRGNHYLLANDNKFCSHEGLQLRQKMDKVKS